MSDLIFTQDHVSQHGTEWTIRGKAITSLCVLCVIEKLDHESHSNNNQLQQLTVFVKTVLNELIEAFNKRDITVTRLFHGTENGSVVEHLCRVLMGLFINYTADVHQLIIQVIVAVFSLSNSNDLHRMILRETIQSISTVHNFSNSMGQLSLLGQHLHIKRYLSKDIIQLHGAFLWYLVEGLTYPDEPIRSLVVYVFVQLCSDDTLLQVNIVNELCKHVPASLAGSRLNDLTINLMGLIQALVHVPIYAQCLLQVDHAQSKDTNIASALKRVLLSNDEVLQLSGIQCITNILTNDTEYITVLVTTDLPVYLFEILSSDNDRLVSLSLECLVSVSTTTVDMFSSCHAVFGYEALLNSIEKALTVKNYTAVQSGLLLLINIIDRPSLTVNTRSVYDRILAIVSMSLPHVSWDLCAAVCAKILRPDTIPSDKNLADFFPLLSHFLKHIRLPADHAPTTSHTPVTNGNDPNDIQCILLVFRNISLVYLHRLSLAASDQDKCVSDQDKCVSDQEQGVSDSVKEVADVFGYLLKAMEMKLIPCTLLFLGGSSVQSQQLFVLLELLFDILTTLFLLNKDYSPHLALHFIEAGLIQLVFDFKSKCDRSHEFDSIANKFIEELCYNIILWDTGSIEESEEMRKVLRLSLPIITCSVVDSLKLLLQRVSLQVSDSQLVSTSCQRTVLCLLYYLEKTQKEPAVSPEVLYNTLNGYLSLNCELYLLSPSTLKHLVALYSSTSLIMSAAAQTQHNNTGIIIIGGGEGLEIICQSLLKLSDPSLAFTHHISLLVWAYGQQTLSGITSCWLEKWLECLKGDNECKNLVHSLTDISQLLDNALDILIYGTRGMQSAVHLINEIMKLETVNSSSYVLNRIECVCMSQNIPIMNLSSIFAVLSLLSLDNNLKLVCQIISILSNFCSSNVEHMVYPAVLLQGLKICLQTLEETSLLRVQVSNLLISNDVIMKQALLHLYRINEIELLSTCLEVIMLLIDISHSVRQNNKIFFYNYSQWKLRSNYLKLMDACSILSKPIIS